MCYETYILQKDLEICELKSEVLNLPDDLCSSCSSKVRDVRERVMNIPSFGWQPDSLWDSFLQKKG